MFKLEESARKLAEAKKKRGAEMDRLLQQYERQNLAERSVIESEDAQARQAEYDDATMTGDDTARGAAAGSSFGVPGLIVGSVLSSIPAKGKEYTARAKQYKDPKAKRKAGETGSAVFDTWFNPATTIPSLLEGLGSSLGTAAGAAQGAKQAEGRNQARAPSTGQSTYMTMPGDPNEAPTGYDERMGMAKPSGLADWATGGQTQGSLGGQAQSDIETFEQWKARQKGRGGGGVGQ